MSRPVAVALITFAASVLGMVLQSLIAVDVLNASKGPVGAMTGVIALLLALVLGLLVWTAFGVFSGQQSDALSLGPLIQAARGLARKYQETQIAMLIRLANPFPPRVLDFVVFWSAILFLGDGLVAAPNVVTVSAHFVGAVGIASATFLILELSRPYGGFIRLAPAGLDRLIETLGEVEPVPAE